jgi:cytochrome c oxidase subunit 2
MLDWLPENVSSFGKDIDGIMYLIYYLVGAWFLLAEGVFLYFVIHHRRRPGVRAAYAPGTTPRALMWVVIPAALVLVCDFAIDAKGSAAWEKIKIHIPPHEVLVRIEGRQFAWNFRNAGPDGVLDTADDIVTNGQLHVPINKVVRFEGVATDVVHSFWVPNLRLKQDLVPGRTIPGWFMATREGQFGIGCAELCGTGHGVMGGTLIVQSEKEYQDWLKN